MKNLLLTLFALCCVINLSAQGNVYVEDSLAIGTHNPNAELHFKGNMATNWGFRFKHDEPTWGTHSNQTWLRKSWSGTTGDMLYLGSTGNRATSLQSAILLAETGTFIGKGSDDAKSLSSTYAKFDASGADVTGTVRSSAGLPKIELFDNANGENRLEGSFNEGGNNIHLDSYWGDLKFRTGDAGTITDRMTIDGATGGVGIGTSNVPSGYRMAVDGNIIAERVRVQLSQNWPDYVFNENYDLMTIDDLKDNIAQNGHLPNIPDAATMTAEGQDLGEMQVKMMEKIEELTLYIIDLNERIKTLEEENTELKTSKK